MQTLTVGEFKSKFSEIIGQVRKGESVGVTYGKKKEKIAVLIPFKKKLAKRKLGIWEGKASFKLSKDFKMTDEELLNS